MLHVGMVRATDGEGCAPLGFRGKSWALCRGDGSALQRKCTHARRAARAQGDRRPPCKGYRRQRNRPPRVCTEPLLRAAPVRACVRATCALMHVHGCARMDVLHFVQYAHFCTGRDTAVMKVIRSPGRSQLMLQCLIGTCRADVNKLDRLGCARPPARPHCPEQSTPSTFANHVPSAQSVPPRTGTRVDACAAMAS